MSLFNSRDKQSNGVSPRDNLMSKYNAARSNLLLVAIFTAINIVLLVIQSNTYFLFSASIPYIVTDTLMVLCGMYPEEYYEGFTELAFLPEGVFAVAIIISVGIIAAYILSYVFSAKNRVGCLIFALVFFAMDTVVMFWWYGISIDAKLDILFHVWVIVSLSVGISAHYKYKNLPQEELALECARDETSTFDQTQEDSPIIRLADTEVKSRTLLEFSALNHNVVYRRVKKVNELVIDGKVYDEYIAVMELAHELTATIDGHIIAAGFNGNGVSYAKVDGKVITQKIRIF